jgi:hypothetical protein
MDAGVADTTVLLLLFNTTRTLSGPPSTHVASRSVSQSVSYFTVPPRAHPSTGSQSGSATPGLTQVPSTRSRGLLNCRK